MRDLARLNANVAQSVERRLGKAEVTGSIPVTRSIFLLNSLAKYFLYESQVRDKGGA